MAVKLDCLKPLITILTSPRCGSRAHRQTRPIVIDCPSTCLFAGSPELGDVELKIAGCECALKQQDKRIIVEPLSSARVSSSSHTPCLDMFRWKQSSFFRANIPSRADQKVPRLLAAIAPSHLPDLTISQGVPCHLKVVVPVFITPVRHLQASAAYSERTIARLSQKLSARTLKPTRV